MKWRCVWCGKPHEFDDPPCESCGHGEFEKAVVREPEYETVDTGPQYLWVCSNCGCQHVKNNPPCSRCGNHELEKVEQNYDGLEDELAVPSWLEVARPYLPIFAVALVVLALFATGILPLSLLFPGSETPTPPDAPGDAETAAGIDLADVESAVHNYLEDERETQGVESREYDRGLAGIAEYRNRGMVLERHGEEPPDDPDWNAFDPDCGGNGFLVGSVELESIDAYDSADSLAEAVADRLVADRTDLVLADRPGEGVDIHVGTDGTVFVTYAVC